MFVNSASTFILITGQVQTLSLIIIINNTISTKCPPLFYERCGRWRRPSQNKRPLNQQPRFKTKKISRHWFVIHCNCGTRSIFEKSKARLHRQPKKLFAVGDVVVIYLVCSEPQMRQFCFVTYLVSCDSVTISEISLQ